MTQTAPKGTETKKTANKGGAPDDTTKAAAAAPSTPAMAPSSLPRDEEWVEFNTGFFQTDGFWQNPVEGEWIDGILLSERRVTSGSALKQPYYIFSLLTEFPRMTTRVDPNKPGTKDNQQVVPCKVGMNIGVKASYDLQGIMRHAGHRFRIKCEGKKPTKTGNTVIKFKKVFSQKKYRDIEIVNESQEISANDEVVGGEEIPF